MKTIKSLAALATLILASNAYAVDFGSIIKENSKAQLELHQQIKESVDSSRLAVQIDDSGSQVITDKTEVVHVKTKKDMLTFAKEKRNASESAVQLQEQSDKRLALEFKDLE